MQTLNKFTLIVALFKSSETSARTKKSKHILNSAQQVSEIIKKVAEYFPKKTLEMEQTNKRNLPQLNQKKLHPIPVKKRWKISKPLLQKKKMIPGFNVIKLDVELRLIFESGYNQRVICFGNLFGSQCFS